MKVNEEQMDNSYNKFEKNYCVLFSDFDKVSLVPNNLSMKTHKNCAVLMVHTKPQISNIKIVTWGWEGYTSLIRVLRNYFQKNPFSYSSLFQQ